MRNSDEISYWVPTRGRTHRRPTTLDHLSAAGLLDRTYIVCPSEEKEVWVMCFPEATVLVHPPEVNNIGKVRAWMLEQCTSKYFFMIDDDITFSWQWQDRSTHPLMRHPLEMHHLLHTHLLELFRKYPVVGIGSRLFCQERDFITVNRQTGWAWGYEKAIVYPILKPIFGRLIVHEDTDWCLTLLEAGIDNVITSSILASGRAVADNASEGGCGIYRNPELVMEETKKFAAFHPDSVTLKEPRPGLPATTQYRHTVKWRRFVR